MKRFVPCLLGAFLMIAGVPAHADGLFSSTQLCSQGDGNYSDLFSYCSFSSGSGNLSVTTPNPDGVSPDQVFTGTATAIANPGVWKVAVDLSVTDYRQDMYIWSTVPDTGNPVIATTGAATAGLTDSLTVDGGTGVYSLSFIFSLDGSLTTTDSSLLQPEFCASLYMPEGVGTDTSTCLGYGSSVPTTFTLTYADLPFGGPVDPELLIQALGLIYPIYPYQVGSIGDNLLTGSLGVDFGSTVTLTDLLVTDANGNPIPGVTIKSGDGITYPLDPANISTPEPGWLSPLGLLLLAGLRRFRR